MWGKLLCKLGYHAGGACVSANNALTLQRASEKWTIAACQHCNRLFAYYEGIK